MQTYINLKFETDLNQKKFTLRVDNFNDTLTEADIINAMNEIIDSEALFTKNGRLIGILGAEKVVIGKTVYNLD